MKKRFSPYFIACVLMAILSVIFVSCKKNSSASSDKIKIVTTIFPEYDWARQIVGEKKNNVELTLLLDNGVDLHSYQPSVQDIARISSADVFVYVGGESDEWVEDVLSTAHNKRLLSLNLLEILGDWAKEEEIVEGMQADEDDEAEEEPEFDEHVWLSLRNAKIFCRAIADALCKIEPSSSELYRANCASYEEKLSLLDSAYTDAVKGAKRNTILFADRFPFLYLADDYGITYYAAFVGCSAETEASFKTIAFLSQKVNELNLECVLKIEGSEDKIARTVIQNSEKKNARILTLDSIQSVTSVQIKSGASYIGLMESNLEVLKEALR